MQYSTQGYHTLDISKRLSVQEKNFVLEGFKNYRDKAEKLRVRPNRDRKGVIKPNFYCIEYAGKQKGISWYITYSPFLGKRPYSIHARINPKIIIGTKDYLRASDESFFEDVESFFNLVSGNISFHLGQFRDYTFHRIDYCINFDTRELGLPCSSGQMMKLIRRADVPAHFEEWTAYDQNAHRGKADKKQFRLESASLVVNCYEKYTQLQKEWPDCPDLEKSSNIIRFEIQCRYPKVYSMSTFLRNRSYCDDLKRQLLSDYTSECIVQGYFDKVIKGGDYFSLDAARRMLELYNFKSGKENRLIRALELVNERRGIAKAKARLGGEELDTFRRSLRELAEMGINPVTIPRDWGTRHIPGLYRAYRDKLDADRKTARLMLSGEILFERLLAECLG